MKKYMKEVIKLSEMASSMEETPIGAVIVRDNKIIARAFNKRNIEKNVLGHAEIEAITKASKKIGDWRLNDCDMYVLL